ncbi:MAG: hypothetical protein R2822_12905 [Spirosomataceae bacterium]
MKPYTLLFLVILLKTPAFSQDFDLLIRGGKIMDGTGNAWFYGDVGIKNGNIARIGVLSNATATQILEA